MRSTVALRGEVIANLSRGVEQRGNIGVFFKGIAHQFLGATEERLIASTLVIPVLAWAADCRAFAYCSPDPGAGFRDIFVMNKNRQTTLKPGLAEAQLLPLLVGTGGKRPSLVWSLHVQNEQFTWFLDRVFDPHILTNARTICGPGAIRYAQQKGHLEPEKVWFVLPANSALSGCLLYFNKASGPGLLDLVLERVGFSENYRRLYSP